MSIHNDACIQRDTSDDINARGNDFTRKRRRDEVDKSAIHRRPFSIRADALDVFAKPRIFTPLCLLPRSRLPLACLDTAYDGSRLFSAHVSTLEAAEVHEAGDVVLIVEDSEEARLYAVERVQKRRYALCRLAAWVETKHLTRQTGGRGPTTEPPRKRQALQPLEHGEPWWNHAQVDVDLHLPHSETNGSGISKLCLQVPTDTRPTTAPKLQLEPSAVEKEPATLEPPAEPPTSPKSVSSVSSLEELAKQYLEALYTSRLPLAFFVKGPLARARAAFTLQPADLIEFLRGAILPAPVMDKKFRESITQLVKELCVLETPEKNPKQRKKRKWKAKRDKAGYFVDEKDYVEQWWRREDDGERVIGPNETVDAAVKRRSQRLRNRETFLQVILIHEITALEASAPHIPQAAPADTAQTPLAPAEEDTQSKTDEKRPRKKKEIDVAVTLATLLDRLCIWYSIESSSPVKNGGAAEDEAKGEANDDLKSFARDVIVPFFQSRIPELANATSGKLGGPQAPTPKRKTASTARRPGEPAARQAPEQKPRGPLARVSTDTLKRSSKRPPVLHRAATDTDALIPLVKREMSEPRPLHGIPVVKKSKPQPGQRVQPKRVSLLEQASFGRREVDLSAMSQANDTKMRKKADVEARLRDAITTLKKPNRDRAVEEIAKHADQSFAKAIAKGRNQTHHPRKAGAEKKLHAVSATPSQIKATPVPKRRVEKDATNSRGSAGISIVPSSSARLLARPGDVPSSSFAVPQSGHRPRHANVEETPSRGLAKFMPAALSHQPGTLLESPTASRTAQIAQTPAKPIKMASLAETPGSKPGGWQTRTWSPLKLHNKNTAQCNDDGLALTEINGASIYDALGWNDDYDELA